MVSTVQPETATQQRPGPKAGALVERDKQVISPSYTRSYPFVMDHGKGSEVWDIDGNRFVDFTAGVAVLAAGHAHPAVVEAITRQAQKYIHMAGTDFYLPEAVDLAETLTRITPGAYDKQVFFTNSGTESTEAAMKLCHYATGRPCFISFLGAFHGRTYGSMSLGSSKALHRSRYQPLLAGIYHAPYPDPYRPPVRRADRAPWPRLRRLHRARDDAPPGAARTRSPASSSSRSRARAATSCRRLISIPRCGSCATSTTSRLWSTRCNRAWAAPARCTRSSTGASCPT